MKALVYHGPGRKAWEEVPDAAILEPTDVVVRVDTTTICGTDLHILQGDVPAVTDGRIIGIGDYEAKKTIDLKGAYLAPSFIDGHFHVESSMLTMPEFGTIWPDRTKSSTFSVRWPSSLIFSRSKKPAPPLIECAARKTRLTSCSSIALAKTPARSAPARFKFALPCGPTVIACRHFCRPVR